MKLFEVLTYGLNSPEVSNVQAVHENVQPTPEWIEEKVRPGCKLYDPDKDQYLIDPSSGEWAKAEK